MDGFILVLFTFLLKLISDSAIYFSLFQPVLLQPDGDILANANVFSIKCRCVDN